MSIYDILAKFRQETVTERHKGALFEKLMQRWLQSDPRFCNQLKEVWLWEDFPQKSEFGGKDIGIDLVAKTDEDEYWAIQCKFYDENTTIDKPAVDSFLSTSSKTFTDPTTLRKVGFAHRLWISTTDKWGTNALEAIQNQTIPVSRIGVNDLDISPVNWDELINGKFGTSTRIGGKQLKEHQLIAISKAAEYYKTHRRGKLIMACGTGKTFTSLKLVENQLGGKGLVLFMVPSIALLGQTLNAWFADSDPNRPIKGICICSDNKANKRIAKATDDSFDNVIDLALPASTNPNTIARQLQTYKNYNGLVVVFSTYQSIDVIHEAQQIVWQQNNQEYGDFDFIVCDEAHRTTGAILKDKEESHFTKIHDEDYIMGKYRLYMTATPRLYGESAKVKASEKECILCSMDDKEIYGEEIYRVSFSYAVQHGLLTDYKVLVLTVNENDVPDSIKADLEDPTKKELNFDDTTKLIGVINGLAKRIKGDGGKTWEVDPRKMKRAVAFCSEIGREDKAGSSKNVASVLPEISKEYYDEQTPEERAKSVIIEAEHIDGSMDSLSRNEKLNWLREEPEENVCKVITNVRCLSEGVDVPALDAVLFLSAKNSQVDVVQSVGRIMRNFRKGEADEKKYGYIIIPIVVPSDVKPEDALNNSKTFEVVWSILNALRSHDDNFNATVNKIALNKNKDSKVIIGGAGIGMDSFSNDPNDERDAKLLSNEDVAKQLELQFGELQQGIYAKLVEKCGDRLYWENWAKEVGEVAKKFITRITQMVLKEGVHKEEFDNFLKGLQKNINDSIDGPQAIEMLAQHLITKPVFDALFSEYQFVKNNPVSISMEKMIKLLEDKGLTKDLEVLDKFYDSVKQNVSDIDNLEGKQSIIKNLYEKFFKGAFPMTVEKLGIVYTPVECVDFIIHSVNDILKQEFNTSLTEENVHILDPFTGTGTFITRLLQSGLIKKEDMERKYRNEIHCNEIVLLAYYIADVNIESVFHDLTQRKDYLLYDGICLTDTFQLNETGDNDIFSQLFPENSERLNKQKKAPVRVVIGNPPYSARQKNANDNAKNLKYLKLDERIANTYAKHTDVTNLNSLYDSYIRAFRWASDRISTMEEGGIVAYITNSGWLDKNTFTGFRKTLENEFSSIYVLNLKGSSRGTDRETSKKEGQNVFDIQTGVAITILAKKKEEKKAPAIIHYRDIGDYLDRKEKLGLLKKWKSIKNIEWEIIKPNKKLDWINQRNSNFDNLILIGEKDKQKNKYTFFEPYYSCGLKTQRDLWCYNSSKKEVERINKESIEYYNQQRESLSKGIITDIDYSTKKISWTGGCITDLRNQKPYNFNDGTIVEACYRPFFKQNLFYYKPLNERQYQIPKLYPDNKLGNISICICGMGGSKAFSCLATKVIPDLNILNAGAQCFSLYWYEDRGVQKGGKQLYLFNTEDTGDDKYIRHDGISDWILKEVRSRYGNAKNITKEHIFYYVYGLLHSEEYRTRFADDLRKSLPRIPIVEKVEDFMAFYKAGKALAELHLNYEEVEPCPGVTVEESGTKQDEYTYYTVEKMRFPSGKKGKDKPSTIQYNGQIVVRDIPQVAYDYVVNGKSAIEWIMERYQVTIDKDSQIKNDPNDWSREHSKPRYILDLLLSVINVSVQTVAIVKSLPSLNLGIAQSTATQPVTEAPAMTEILEDVAEEDKFVQFLPFYNLKAACGAFEANELPTQTGWIDISTSGVHPRGDKNYFICQAKGNSMQPKIEDGDWVICRFYTPDNGGSRNGKMVIAQISEYDGDYDGKYTLKEYHSEKNADGSRKSIMLRPLNKEYTPIELHEEDDVKVVAVVEAVMKG